MAPLTIDLYSDIVCPWCYIGAAHLKAALSALPDAADIQVVYRPFMLDPSTPPGGVDLASHLKRKYGGDPASMFARVEQAGRAAGVTIDFKRQTRGYATASAHTLLRHAISRGTQPALAHALHNAYFTEGLAIDDPAVLDALASAHGFEPGEAARLIEDPAERALTFQQAAEASERGIRGVPFFVLAGQLGVSGAQPADVLRRAIAQARALPSA
jgi:predicted DsbA family dithiol-disulfide isomerase